jgi:tRNA (Thr-GGU) A37 N-methylase
MCFVALFLGERGDLLELVPIGVIHSPYIKREEAPRQGRLSDKESVLEIYSGFEEGLQDIEDKRHIVILLVIPNS